MDYAQRKEIKLIMNELRPHLADIPGADIRVMRPGVGPAGRADIMIEDKVIVELKSVQQANNAHKKQVLTNLKLTGIKLGFLLNFGEAFMKNGITRVVNGVEENE